MSNRELAAAIAGPGFKQEDSPGEALIGAIGLIFDLADERNRHAKRASWSGDTEGPAYDGLDLLAHEQGQLNYPLEHRTDREARVDGIWDSAQLRATVSHLVNELAAAGYPGAIIYYAPTDRPGYGGPRGEPAPWWSQFWVAYHNPTFDLGLGPLFADDLLFGSFNFGGDSPQVQKIIDIIKRYKPGHWVCRAVEVTSGGPVFADDLLFGSFEFEDGGVATSITVTG